jgi:hypothetical protein
MRADEESTTTGAIAGAVVEPVALHCVRCRYDLRGQPPEGRCPECGLPVRNSAAAPDELHLAPPRWLWAIACGAALVLFAQVLFISGMFFAGSPGLWSIRTVQTIDATAVVVMAAGVWLLTRRQRPFSPSRFVRRWLVRLAALCLVASHFFLHAGLYTGDTAYLVASRRTGFAAVILLPLTLFEHLWRLALRARNRPLANHCRIAGAGFAASVLLLAGLDLAAEHHWRIGRSELDVPVVVVALTFIFYGWAAITLLRFTFAFWALWRESTKFQ